MERPKTNEEGNITEEIPAEGIKLLSKKQPLVVHIVVPEAVRPPHPSREAHSNKQNLLSLTFVGKLSAPI